MKFWTIAGFLTGLVVLTVVVHKAKYKQIPIEKNPDMRYRSDDLLTDQDF